MAKQIAKSGKTERRLIGSRREYRNPALEEGTLLHTDLSGTRGYGTQWARGVMGHLQSMCDNLRGKPMPAFSSRTSVMDRWLQDALHAERTGFLAAFMDQASMIQANRHWRLVGPRSIVDKTLDFLHESEGGEGFRKLIKMTALNYYSSNFGGAIHLHRKGPVKATYNPFDQSWNWVTPNVIQMYATDSTNFEPNYDYVYPFTYGGDPWSRYDFLRIVSMPSTQIRTWNVGRCALFRCIQIAQMTSAIYEHIFNVVSPDTAKGIVTIKGLTGSEFLEALSGSEATNEQDGSFRNGFGPPEDMGEIVVLADRENEIKVQFVMLSRMPENFFLDQWVRWTLTAFSTNLGFPLEEFTGSQSNALLGQSGAEVEAGQQRGATKGDSEFISYLQEGLQNHVIPRTVHFEFAGRDDDAELVESTIRLQKVQSLRDLFEATQQAILIREFDEAGKPVAGNQDTVLEAKAKGQHIIDRDEARALAQEWGIFPAWLAQTETADVAVDDAYGSLETLRLRQKREKAMTHREIRRLVDTPTGDPVVEYDQWIDKPTGMIHEQYTTLWESDDELSRPTLWQVNSRTKAVLAPVDNTEAQRAANWESAASTPDYPRDAMLGTELIERANGEIGLIDVYDGEAVRSFKSVWRRVMRAQRDGTTSSASLIGQRDREILISRLYAAAQLGRDNVVSGRKLSQTVARQLSGELLDYATRRVDGLINGGGAISDGPPDDPALANSLDDATFALLSGPCPEGMTPEECAADRERKLNSRINFISNHEMARAFSAGQIITGRQLGGRRKTWVETISQEPRDIHLNIVGETVNYEDSFSNGEFWAQQLPGCNCSIKVSFN